MPSGKMAAQAGHAFCGSLELSRTQTPNIFFEYNNIGGSKIALKSKSLNHLINAYENCLGLGIPAKLIVDQNHILLPHFTGKPIITALGIGPCKKGDIKNITKKFQCV